MMQLGKRHISLCLGLLLGVILLYSLYDGSDKHEDKKDHPEVRIICMPDDYIDTPFIKQVRKNETVILPEVATLEALSGEELAVLYHRYIENLQYMCKRKVRLGQIDDGGWDICDEDRFRLTEESCIVYSFGINNDFSFDEAVTKYYGCEVHSFDPSMNMDDFTKGKIHFHNLGISARDEVTDDKWNLLRYNSIRSKLGHKKNISVLKMDIEIYEWEVLPDIISTGDLAGTYNLVVEFHLAMSSPEQGKDKYLPALKLLKSLYDHGYRIFWTHQNKWCQFVSKCKQELRTNCHEVNFVKIR
ncbi:probable methyltransferase-like protein 24 isoform X2 [Mercenaria mercenaria]|uniref:probable methyltransferase-like protein 24 isoform X2 n=1 Tax=Mercenaria mercenaria TaxID=6596 RepID=UPI00234F8BCD|nr:probable methyltransferase-like protein 24 isoform X2 [Mercenaria mercenaria]